jgi:signal transduction histidine kinase
MPDRVSSRIAVAFAIVGLVAVLVLGGGLFVSLRSLHRETTISGLGDLAQPLVARVRAVGAVADVRTAIAALKTEIPEGVGLYALVGDRAVTADGGEAPVDVSTIVLDPAMRAGESTGGELSATDGTRVLYAATLVRKKGALLGPIAIVLTTPDRTGALALRDLLRVLPVAALLIALLVAPVAWLLSRSITRPLRRLAEATATVPGPHGGSARPPIPTGGPREVRDLTASFNAMTDELDRVRGEERELLANIRHDLKTPLTAVAGFAEALRDGTAAGTEGAVRAGDAIAQEATRMGRLIEDLRSIDELGAARHQLRPEALDPAMLVGEAVARFEPRADAAGVELRAESDGRLSLVADRAAIERILGNLLENALAMVPAGGHVLVEARSAAAGAIALRVSDDGPGFAPGSLERAFDRFYRADPARSGPGTGLGLSIVRALARAHGGDAVAENLAPTGARVTVTLLAVPRSA